MKATLLSCAVLLALTNCANSSGEGDDGGADVVKVDAKADAGKPDAPTEQCIPQCTSDDDCSGSCPAVPNGVNCCDTSTGICYAYSASSCPAPVADAGFD